MSPNESNKEETYAELARIGKALASPGRLRLLDALCQKPSCVDELAERTSMSVANTSQHLKVLRSARLVHVRVEGARRVYRLADPDVAVFFAQLGRLGRHRLPQVDKLLSGANGHSTDLSPHEVLRQLQAGECHVIDVRPEDEFRAGHLAGARCIPLHDLPARLSELDRALPVIAYCRGPHCGYAAQAVIFLREQGYRAERLEAGPAELLEAGLTLEAGA